MHGDALPADDVRPKSARLGTGETTLAPADDSRVDLGPLLRLAGPVVLSRIGIMAMGLVDTVVVGRYSAEQLGYHALGWAPTGVVLTTAIGLLSGVQVLTSQAIGEGRHEVTGAILRRGLLYAVWLGIGSALLLGFAGGPFMHHVGLDPALADGATPVLQVFALSLLPILVADSGIFWLEAHGRPTAAAIAMWAANVVNLALNLWLVPGHSGLPVAGAVASAWSTCGARIALLGFVAIAIVTWREARPLGVFAPTPRDARAAADMRRIGYGASLSYFIETSAFGAMGILAGWIGVASVAAWAIVINMAAFVFMIPLGLATATGVLVGRAYGARDHDGIVHAGRLGFGAATGATLAVCAIVGFGNHAIAAAYTSDATVQGLVASALLLSCLFYVADGLQVVGAQACRAQSDAWVPAATHVVSYTLIMTPLAYVFAIPMGLGIDGIIWAVIVSSLVSAGLLWGRFAMLAQRSRRERAAVAA